MFRQHTSRRHDPQLHTHAVIANRVKAPDGRWLALDARTLKIDQRTLSGLYHVGLRAELTGRLGVAWESPVNGIAEIAGIGPEVLAEFSQRTGEIERRVADKLTRFRTRLEREPTQKERWQLEREAVLDSRPTKQHNHSADQLHDEWRRRIGTLGFEHETLVADVTGRILGPVGIDRREMRIMTDEALESLAGRQSTWRPAEVVRELAAQVPTHVTVGADELTGFLQLLADHVAATRCVDLSPPVPEDAVLRRDGRPTCEAATDRRLTTQAILDEENQIVEWAERQCSLDMIDTRPVDLDVGWLSPGQAEACRAVAGTTPFELIVGPAGSGKTTALTPAVHHLQGRGQVVFGVAPTAAAADVLATETTMPADTLDKLLYEHTRIDRPPASTYDLPQGATVILDEAGALSTPKLAAFIRLANLKGWRVVMVGDPRQFSAVGRGGMFNHLIDTYGAIELDHIHRFTHRWERNASRRLRTGDTAVIAEYERHGRLHGGNQDAMEAAIVDAWNQARQRDESVALMANTNHTVDRLNHLAQQHRIDARQLDPNEPTLHLHGQQLLIGDEVVTRRNQRTLRTDRGAMVKNRDHWTIQHIHPDGAVTVTGPTGTVCLPAEYTLEHLELGYAQTSHATQGRTVDVGLLLIDGAVDCRGFYTPMTRGRHANHAYIVTEDETAADILTAALSRDWIDQPAIAQQACHCDTIPNSSPGHDDHRDLRQPGADPGHQDATDNSRSDQHQAWQTVSRSIEAARRRNTTARASSRRFRVISR